jgi:hypothetical protein
MHAQCYVTAFRIALDPIVVAELNSSQLHNLKQAESISDSADSVNSNEQIQAGAQS